MKNNSNSLCSRFVKRSFSTSLVMAALATLSACGGSDDKIEDQPTPTMSTFSLSVSDAPVDDASEVVVYFDEVELIGNESPITFSVEDENGDPRSIDLLSLPGEQFEVIVEDTAVVPNVDEQDRILESIEKRVVRRTGRGLMVV